MELGGETIDAIKNFKYRTFPASINKKTSLYYSIDFLQFKINEIDQFKEGIWDEKLKPLKIEIKGLKKEIRDLKYKRSNELERLSYYKSAYEIKKSEVELLKSQNRFLKDSFIEEHGKKSSTYFQLCLGYHDTFKEFL
jgi:hypothetical protein